MNTLSPLALLTERVEHVLRGYVQAMLWANATCGVESCEDGQNHDCEHTNDAHGAYELDDFPAADQASMREDVEAFVLSNLEDFEAYLEQRSYDPSQGTAADYFGHDFALTRNGHGAGFWDRGLGDLGDRLTEQSKPYGDSHVVVTEDSVSLM